VQRKEGRVRTVRLVIALALGCVGAAGGQLAITRPTTKLLILPLGVTSPADSATSIATMDAARDRLAVLARYKVIVVPKAKLCEALKASGFPCDLVLDEGQARELARFLNVEAYTTGVLSRSGSVLGATVRVVDIGSSGFPFLFSVASGTPATPAALGEAIAQRLNTIVRAGESARECYDKRSKGQLPAAVDAARKALSVEPTLPAAHLCLATVYEAQRFPPDSLIAAAQRATIGDSLNPTAWETMARAYQMKNDTVRAVDAFQHQLRGEPQNTQLRLGIAELLRQERLYPLAVTVLDEGLARKPGDPKLLDLKASICIEGQLWRCVLDGFVQRADADSSVLEDSAFLKGALGAAQQVSDTQQLLHFSRVAVRHFSGSAAFRRALGQAFDLKGMPDSALAAYRQLLALDPSDAKAPLLVAKAIVDQAVYDTAAANRLKGDTARLRGFRTAFADRLDTARAYLGRAMASPDTSQQLNAAVILLTGGSKLAQAGAYDRAYAWLDEALRIVNPRSAADTGGPRQQVRVQASFWFGIASVASLQEPYRQMVASKSCVDAKAINSRLDRTRGALILGSRVSPNFANTMLQNLAKFEAVMPQVKKQFKCSNF
jgi:tetratricopeptide (TPR) repeat protein